MQNSVSIRDLSLSFGAVTVLENLNLDIGEGEFLVLLGSSGCGKSTLLNCIAGLLEPTGGQIFIKNRNVTWNQRKLMFSRDTAASANVIRNAKTPVIASVAAP